MPVTGKMTRMSMVATLFFCVQYYKFSCRYTKKEGESERERETGKDLGKLKSETETD